MRLLLLFTLACTVIAELNSELAPAGGGSYSYDHGDSRALAPNILPCSPSNNCSSGASGRKLALPCE
jgi:hypothetical protein